mgnify:CR=1 FL=1
MELNLHPIATKSFVSGREFAEHDRVVSYLVRPSARTTPGSETGPAFARYDLFEDEDLPAFGKGDFSARPNLTLKPEDSGPVTLAFVYCRWVTAYKPRKDDNSDLNLKLTAETLFLTIAIPAGSLSSSEALSSQLSAINTPLLQFLALMMERKKLIKLRGYTEDGQRQIYEHMASHQMYEVPVGDLNVEFFQKIQEHLGVLVGTPKVKAAPAAPVEPAPAPVAAVPVES